VTEDVLDDEWEDIEAPIKGAALPPVQIRLTRMRGSKSLAFFAFRGEAATWLTEHGPRFKAQIGGQNADKVRLLSDSMGGRYEPIKTKGGTLRINLGHVTAWPNEVRKPVSCAWQVSQANIMVLTLPAGWTRPTAVAAVPAPAAPAPALLTRPAATLPEPARKPVNMGEPPPGRSALDQRKALP